MHGIMCSEEYCEKTDNSVKVPRIATNLPIASNSLICVACGLWFGSFVALQFKKEKVVFIYFEYCNIFSIRLHLVFCCRK